MSDLSIYGIRFGLSLQPPQPSQKHAFQLNSLFFPAPTPRELAWHDYELGHVGDDDLTFLTIEPPPTSRPRYPRFQEMHVITDLM